MGSKAFDGFRATLATIVPKWLSNRPGFQVGFKFLWSMAVILDVYVEQAVEGVYAAFPGVGTPTALSLIGLSRSIPRGQGEPSATYAARLVDWRATAEALGSSEDLAQQIQAYLGTSPIVRVVDRAGNWVVCASDGTTTKIAAADAAWQWDWDSKSNPERGASFLPWWSDIWIIVSPGPWAVTAGTIGGGGLADIWGMGLDVGIGHAVPAVANDAIRALVTQVKGAHTWVEAIIWSYDATLFDPTSVNSGNPDGTWGGWGFDARDGNGVQPRRAASARYWIPPNG